MFLSNHLDFKYLKTAVSQKRLHPVSLSYPPGQQLQEKPQIQRTEVSTNHVLIYFEEVRSLCNSARSGRTTRGSNKLVQILNSVFQIHR